MNLDGMIGKACEKRDGETDIDASNNVDVDYTTEDAAIRETGADFVLHESGSGCVCGGIIIKKKLWDRRHGNGFDRAIAGFTVAW
jgi:hypothetical protein